jgi:hypothetical protein
MSHDGGLPVLWLATALNRALTAAGRAAHKAMARGTLAPRLNEQAAEGQTAQLSTATTPRCATRGHASAKHQKAHIAGAAKKTALAQRGVPEWC